MIKNIQLFALIVSYLPTHQWNTLQWTVNVKVFITMVSHDWMWRQLVLAVIACICSCACTCWSLWIFCLACYRPAQSECLQNWALFMKNFIRACTFFFFLIGIHPMQGWAATTRHGVTRSTKRITGYSKSVEKEPTVKRYLLILNLKPLRSKVKGKHSIGREFHSLALRGKKLLI